VLSGERHGFYITGNFVADGHGALGQSRTLLHEAGYATGLDDQGAGGLVASLFLEITSEGTLRFSMCCGIGEKVAVATGDILVDDGEPHTFRIERVSSRVRLQLDNQGFLFGGQVECTGVYWSTLHIGGRGSESAPVDVQDQAIVGESNGSNIPRTETRHTRLGNGSVPSKDNFRGQLGNLRYRAFWTGKNAGKVNLVELARANPTIQHACGNDLSVNQSYVAVSEPPLDAPGSTLRDTSCTSGVLYGFIDSSAMPLRAAWQTYFDGCPRESFKVLAHATNQTQWKATKTPWMENVAFVDPNELVPGDQMRFSFGMVRAMQQIMKIGTNPVNFPTETSMQGCRPQWIQFLSDSCLPVTSCAEVHRFLSRQPPHSFVGFRPSPPHVSTNPLSRVRCKSSQWITLHQTDIQLFAHELLDQDFWETFPFAPDEYYFCTELRSRQRRTRGHVMLYNEMPSVNQDGHAKWMNNSDLARITDKQCINEPFVRKFEGFRDVTLENVVATISKERRICVHRERNSDNRKFDPDH
jgi:hypothetical protein